MGRGGGRIHVLHIIFVRLLIMRHGEHGTGGEGRLSGTDRMRGDPVLPPYVILTT